MRSGNAYLATPLARVEVTRNAKGEWLDDLDQNDWLYRFRRFARGENVGKRFLALRRRLEDAVFDLPGHAPAPAEIQALLALLGTIQSALSSSRKAQESVPPVPRLTEPWIQASDDGTSAFRITRALAGLSGAKGFPLPVRAQLFPVHPVSNAWMTPQYRAKHSGDDALCRVRMCVEAKGLVPEFFVSILDRRLWLAEQFQMTDKPLRSAGGIDLDDLVAFLRDDRMDVRIAALLPGLSLCRIPQDADRRAGEGMVPAAFGLLKLCLTPDSTLRELHWLGEDDRLHVPEGLLTQLAAGNAGNRAIRMAWRRLQSASLSPLFAREALPVLGNIAPRRAAAALLIPLRFGATAALGRSVLDLGQAVTN